MSTEHLNTFWQFIEENRTELEPVALLNDARHEFARGDAVLERGTTGGVFWLQPGMRIGEDQRVTIIRRANSEEIAVESFALASWLPGIYRFTVPAA